MIRRDSYSRASMASTRATVRIGLALATLAALQATAGITGSARADTSCSQVPTVYGIPPWGFHTGPYTGASSFAKGHGNINLEANTVSGVMCQQDRTGTIIMSLAALPLLPLPLRDDVGLPGEHHEGQVPGHEQHRREVRRRHGRSRDPLSPATTASVATASSSSSRLPAGTRTACTTAPKSTTRFRPCS